MTTAALSAAPVDEAGVVAGVITTSRQVGGALGIALMGAIVAAAETLPQTDPRFAGQFVHGFQHALETGAAITLVGALASALLVRRGPVGAVADVGRDRRRPPGSRARPTGARPERGSPRERTLRGRATR